MRLRNLSVIMTLSVGAGHGCGVICLTVHRLHSEAWDDRISPWLLEMPINAPVLVLHPGWHGDAGSGPCSLGRVVCWRVGIVWNIREEFWYIPK